VPLELRKLLNDKTPELQNLYNPIFDEASRQEYIDTNELKMRLFEAKWKWLKEKTYGQFKTHTKDMEADMFIADKYDDWMQHRVDFMYNYLDFDNDRSRVREKFINEMHKKTTIKDIGAKLDEFVLSSKAAVAQYFDYGKHVLEQPEIATKDKD